MPLNEIDAPPGWSYKAGSFASTAAAPSLGYSVMTTGMMLMTQRRAPAEPEPEPSKSEPPVPFGRRAIAMSGKIGGEP